MIPKWLFRAILIASISLIFSACATDESVKSPVRTETKQYVHPGFLNLLDAVVRIDVREVTFTGGSSRLQSSVGSGVIISEEGYVLTNAHVVSPYEEEVRITLNNLERVHADLVGWDHWTDLALLKIRSEDLEEKGITLAYAQFGDVKKLEPGTPVYAVGTPNGLSRTVTRGIISNNDRFFEGADGVRGYETGYFNTWLQTDAAINPGNSGGPLVTEKGEIIGINTRGYLGSNNLGFAVPGDTARFVLQGLLENGEITRSYLGIVLGPLQDLENFFKLEVNQGAMVSSVDPGSPAAEGGILPGDILLSMNGEALDGRFPEQLPPIQNRIANAPVGSDINFVVRRQNEELPFSLTTETLESRVGQEGAYEKWGLSVREISRAYARENKLSSDDGLLVIGVQRAYPGARAGIQNGDIILKVNRETVSGIDDLTDLHEAFGEDAEPILVEVSRNFRTSLLILKP